MLRGAVDALRGSGHRHVVVDLRELNDADDAAVAAIYSVGDRVTAEGRRLTLMDRAGAPGR